MVSPHGDRPSRLNIVRQGFVVGILNPKSLVFFAAVFPHFVNRHAGSITEQLVAFGSIFAVMAFLSDSSWGILAGTAREWLMSSHQRLVRMRILSAVVMCSLGLLIIASA